MVKKQSVTKCYRNNYIVYNKLNAKLQKSVTFYTVASNLRYFINQMNDKKEKIYKYREKVLLLLPFLPIAFLQKDYQVTVCFWKCYRSVTAVTALQGLHEEAAT